MARTAKPVKKHFVFSTFGASAAPAPLDLRMGFYGVQYFAGYVLLPEGSSQPFKLRGPRVYMAGGRCRLASLLLPNLQASQTCLENATARQLRIQISPAVPYNN